MIKIQIKSIFGKLLFEYEKENNTIKETLLEAIKSDANLRYANLSDANLSYADLRYANLSGANLSGANLSGANLSGANLSYADLSDANLSGANLSGANLSGANLSYADLSDADLSDTDLSGANLSDADLSDKNIISITRIGSRKSMTTYDFDNNKIWCGRFAGTLEEFENKVNETHKDNPRYLAEYIGFIVYLKSLKEVYKKW